MSLLVSPVHLPGVSPAKPLPSWPAVSIVLLVVFAAIFPPALLTGMNLYLLLLALIVWFCSKEPFDRNLLWVIGPFCAIIIIGLIIGAGEEQYLYFKDAWYASNPAVIIGVGFVFYCNMPDIRKGFRAFVIAGTLLAIIHLAKFAIAPELLDLSAAKLREGAGTGYYAPALAFMIIFGCRSNLREALQLPRWFAVACLLVCIIGIAASFSRTIVMVAIIGLLASLGLFVRGEWLRIGGVVFAGLFLIMVLRLEVDVNTREANTSFFGKLARSTDELSVHDYTDIQSINDNWRGYETARALRGYASGSTTELIFGKGFGAQVDLGLFMPLGSGPRGERQNVRFVPILHNGYAYLLFKGGLAAIVLFGVALIWLYRAGRRSATGTRNDIHAIAGRILQASAVGLAITTWVVGGVFNKLDMFPFLLAAGFLLAALTRGKLERT